MFGRTPMIHASVMGLVIFCLVMISHAQGASGNATVAPRLEINELMEDEKMANLFLQAFQAMQTSPIDDYYSYYQVAAIHGVPFILYRGSEDPSFPLAEAIAAHSKDENAWWPGYCHHYAVTFPTWHRAYMLLMETALRNKSKSIASQYADEDLRREYMQISDELRLPYWNWASDRVQSDGLPAFLTDKTVNVFVPPDNEEKTIQNPLEGYTTQAQIGNANSNDSCSGCNPYDRPYKLFGTGNPWLPDGYRTVRHPNEKNETRVDQLNKSVMFESRLDWQEMLYHALLQDSWLYFSNQAATPEGTTNGTGFLFNNIETVHDSVHIGVGQSGQMGFVPYASLDPIFFLHHGFVEYIFSIWQAMNPDEWVAPGISKLGSLTIAPGTMVDSQTPLAPFRTGDGSPGNPYYTSDDLRNLTNLGYTYKSLEEVKDKELDEKRKILLSLFQPTGEVYTYRWYVAFPNATVDSAPQPFRIRVFLAAPFQVNATTDVSSPYYAGSIWLWQHPPISGKLNFQSVDITSNMDEQGILTNVMPRLLENGNFSSPEDMLQIIQAPLSGSDLQFTAVGTTGEDMSDYVTGLDQPMIYYQAAGGDNGLITMEAYPEQYLINRAVQRGLIYQDTDSPMPASWASIRTPHLLMAITMIPWVSARVFCY